MVANSQGNREPTSARLAALYHAHHSLHTEDIPFWLELARLQGDPVLELGCGSGRVLIPLAKAGHQVFGLDRDQGMLAELRRNMQLDGIERPLAIQVDMAALCLAQTFSLILLPCNTLSTLVQDTRLAVFEGVRRQLSTGGLFAASLPNPERLLSMEDIGESEVEDIFYHPVDGEPVQVSSSWSRQEGGFAVTWHYDHLLPDGLVERTSMEARHGLWRLEDYRQELAAHGLQLLHSYGDFNRANYRNDSPHLILVAGLEGDSFVKGFL